MAKREVTYTSTTVSRDRLPIIQEVKKYAQERLGVVLTSEQVNNFALDMAKKYLSELPKFVADNVEDPDMKAFLEMKAKLEAAGKLPKSK